MENAIDIVTFEPRFAAGVVSVILPIQQEEFSIPIALDGQPDIQDIGTFYQRGNGNFWVALADNEVVGTLGLLDIGHGQAALRKMFVKAEYRGARHSVAHRLLQALVDWCGQRSIREVLLGTTARFLAAHRFYEKNGFREISRAELPPSFPVMTVDSKFYRRALQLRSATATSDSRIRKGTEMEFHAGRLLDHVHLRVADLAASKRFYRAILVALGLPDIMVEGKDYFQADELFVDRADGPISRVHLAFQAPDHATVDAFHRAALAAGGRDNGAPGERKYHPGYYAAFVLDPDGNNIEAVCHGPTRRSAASVVITPADK
jgi:catechol 2,3-dioxygenase-like lactoylglutathione lyase family enzyme/N-acetylglutamate synthase-like GNAT family acetyltransferase